MGGKVRWQRVRKGLPVSGITEIYPSSFATTKKYPGAFDGRKAPPGEAEPRAVKCAQCAFPIEDTAEIDACPFCESDNFLGRRL
jgi:rubrerythrin